MILIEDDGKESIYHAQLSKVSAELVKHGVSAGDILTGIGDWNTANRPVRMISKHLKKTKKRPITLSFGKVDLSAETPEETNSGFDEKKVEPAAEEVRE